MISTRINILYFHLVASVLKQCSRTPNHQNKTRRSVTCDLPLRRTLRDTTDIRFKIPIHFSPTLGSWKQLSLIWTVSVTIAIVFIIFDDHGSLACALHPYTIKVCCVPAFLFLMAHFLLVLGRFIFQGFRHLTILRHPNILKELCCTFCCGYLEQGRYLQASKAWVRSLRLRRCEAGDRRPC